MNRRLLMPLVAAGLALALWRLFPESGPAPRPEPAPAWAPGVPASRPGGPPVLAPPPASRPVAEIPQSRVAPPRLLPGTALLDPATWPWPGEGVPTPEAGRRLARLAWDRPRAPLPGEEALPDPDGIGPCPPRRLPPGRADSPVVRRGLHPDSHEPIWYHRDGSFTALNVYVEEGPGGRRVQGVTIRTGVPAGGR